MAKLIEGYVLDIDTGVGVAAQSVEVRLVTGDTLVAGGTTNPTTTDANGKFTWSIELNPGPVYVIAGLHKRRYGNEVMQAGSIFVSDLPGMFDIFTDGVVSDTLSTLTTTATGTRQLTIQPGRAVVAGHLWTIDTTKVSTGSANTTLANRIDLLVLRQDVSGTWKGRQQIVLAEGTVNGVAPTLAPSADQVDLTLFQATLPQNASSYTAVTRLAAYASVYLGTASVPLASIVGSVASTADLYRFLRTDASGVPTWTSASIHALNDVFTTGAADTNILQYVAAATRWEPKVHDHSAQFAPLSHTHTTLSHTHPSTDITSDLAYSQIDSLVGTGASQIAAGNHLHTGVYAPISHSHVIGDLPTGTTGSTVALGNHLHTGVYAPVSHSHVAADVTGVFAFSQYPQRFSHAAWSDDINISDATGSLIDAVSNSFLVPAGGTWEVWVSGVLVGYNDTLSSSLVGQLAVVVSGVTTAGNEGAAQSNPANSRVSVVSAVGVGGIAGGTSITVKWRMRRDVSGTAWAKTYMAHLTARRTA